ncbi:transposase, partial [Pseudomonas fluorescens]
RYLESEQNKLRVWSPPPKAYSSLKSLLHRRATLIQNHSGLMLSWANEPLLKKVQTAQQKAFKQADQAIQKLLRKVSKEAGIEENIDRCKAIEGVGELTATGLAVTFMRGAFANSDAFIAFLGMDLAVDDSGKKKGVRHLTKKGDPEIRRLTYNAAMAACRSSKWKPFYESYLARGFSKTQALVALARKLCRVAFALMKNQSQYLSA